mgnify:CR=1 FL=1
MKITKQQLKQIIKEELEAVLNEDKETALFLVQATIAALTAAYFGFHTTQNAEQNKKVDELANKMSQMSAEQINNLPSMPVKFRGKRGGVGKKTTPKQYADKFEKLKLNYEYDQKSKMFSLEFKDLILLGKKSPKDLQSILGAKIDFATTRMNIDDLEKQLELVDSDTSLYTSQPSVPSPGAPIKPVDFK